MSKKVYRVSTDEWYPVHALAPVDQDAPLPHEFVALTDAEYKRYEKVAKQFDEWQSKISLLLNGDVKTTEWTFLLYCIRVMCYLLTGWLWIMCLIIYLFVR
jgi:hypothetical protein